MKKLSQKDIEANWQAMNDFLNTCVKDVDNGNTMLFNAQGFYEDKTHGTSTPIPQGSMSYGTDDYGGKSLTIGNLDPFIHFTVISTAFSRFRYSNGILHITGKDVTGTGKGDYEVQLWA